ncbi:PRC-barrel domain containing protein [Rubrobacter marinus]|uniref:PRC-barrel domain containing protein n=1 Tax=Rubrobacter marinus TaxID=2653852 RepID=A0A6G8PVY7_9ACTN|nr:PRC-barrel domain-containing protein [Rubrobacter marinus]QIN78368.1 PRC-barrel domain containing protein [Rubrobacter marinus]
MSAKELKGYSIQTTNGKAGIVQGLRFDDEGWKVRYVVVRAGGWIANRQVLVVPDHVEGADRDARVLRVDLTEEAVKNAPSAETDRPVAEGEEAARLEGYGASPYWGSGWEAAAGAAPIQPGPYVRDRAAEVGVPREEGDPHLRSTEEVEDYSIGTTDGGVGHVEDFVVDDEGWEIRYVVVDTRDWLPGKKVLISPRWTSSVSWPQKELYVDLTQDEIKGAPEWDPNAPLDREYETRLHEHYGRPPYWVYR